MRVQPPRRRTLVSLCVATLVVVTGALALELAPQPPARLKATLLLAAGVLGLLLVGLLQRFLSAGRRTRLLHERSHSEERFRGLAESMPQLVWVALADGSVEYFNPQWFEYTGTPPEQMRGTDWTKVVHPDDMARVGAVWKAAVEQGQPYEVELRYRRADGEYRWFLARAVPRRDAAGDIVRWFGTSTEVTARKHAEDNLRFLAAAGEQLASSLDYEQTLANVAKASVPRFTDWCCVILREGEGPRLKLVAMEHVDAARAAQLRELFARHPPSLEAPHGSGYTIRTGLSQLLPPVTDAAVEQLAKSPEHLALLRAAFFHSSMVVPLTVRGRTIGALTFASVDSRRTYGPEDLLTAESIARRAALAIDNARLFQLAQEERQRAEEANRLKDEFLATVSHELRTPLTAMLGWVQMLRAGTLKPEKHARALETIERNARAQAQLVEDLLDVSRIMSGKLRLDAAPVSLPGVVEAAGESVRPAAEAKGVRLLANADMTEGTVLGDATRLQQVVWNLLANAVKFTPAGGLVRVRLERREHEALLTVMDTGEGIDSAFLPHVFERFRQQDASTTRAHGGLGLGLAIVRHLVEMHGGTVKALSGGRGQGATFEVRLPLLQARRQPLEVEGAGPREPAQAIPLAGLHVLIVDDEADARELLKDLLECYGIRVDTAASAAEALEVLRREPPDVMVSDIGMPGEDGYTLIRKVRALPPGEGGTTPAVALTAYTRPEDRGHALLAGFNLYVPKPVEPSELRLVLATVAGRTAPRQAGSPPGTPPPGDKVG